MIDTPAGDEHLFEMLKKAYIRGATWYRQNEDFGSFLHKAANDYADAATSMSGLHLMPASVAWESTTTGYAKYVTDERYEKFSDAVKRWYKPYRCTHCENTEADAKQPAGYMPTELGFVPVVWIPIERAPKDGTVILCYGEVAGEIYGIYTEKMIYPAQFWGRSDYEGFEWSIPDTDYAAMWMKPTHYLPMPKPPTKETSNA